MNPVLSVIVPSIRPLNLLNLYKSIDVDDFEMIVITPYLLTHDLGISSYKNIKSIYSRRSPNACQQQGLMVATGDYITFAADDGEFLPNALDYAVGMAEENTIVVGKYLEGDNPNPDMLKEDYYKFKYHKAYRIKGVPQDCLIFNCGIISRKLIMQLGGWDAEYFDVPTIGHADLGIRAFKYEAEIMLLSIVK